ncbi:zinc finger protein 14-like [Pseudoliparis swirei]|uniref:zinc finger protein 14-like n=1 Tax=Pseudoliparis swirei TaxID=2059687 RepID=UPI0024BDBAA3|nr:zinc finger protein 14-like [Pseudoliparis swirei]
MDSRVTAASKGEPLPVASLRLLVPPFQLMAASMWQVLRTRDVLNYWKVAEFVSTVTDVVPELLLQRHRAQLSLGLRARYILELCRSDQPVETDFIVSILNQIELRHHDEMKESHEEEVAVHFLDLIQTLLRDPRERRDFFSEVFPAEYGPRYDSDLQALFSEFLRRLAQLLPVPDLEQTASWLGAERSALEDVVRSVSAPADLSALLRTHKDLGHLERHVPPSSAGAGILSSLAAAPPSRAAKPTERPGQSEDGVAPRGLGDDAAVETIAVTEYVEVELDTSADVREATGPGSAAGGDSAAALPEEVARGRAAGGSADIVRPEVGEDDAASSRGKASAGPHDCSDCEKKFKFASSLTAHRVVHTGERPHRCGDCDRRFSFRQSLDRHRRTHRTGRQYAEDGVYACSRTFNWEPALARHLKTHGEEEPGSQEDDVDGELQSREPEGTVSECTVPECTVPECTVSECTVPECTVSECTVPECTVPTEVVFPANVRTSGRKCRPTMKIQVIMATRRRREATKADAPEPKPSTRAEHSDGSPGVSAQDAEDEGSAAAEAPARPPPRPPPGEEGRFGCPDCQKSFKFQSLLNAHRRIHTGEQPFLCAQCGRRFSFKQSLERHRHTHRGGRRYECPICGEFFKSPAAQREHRGAHMENGEYLCSRCGRAFAWKSALVRHLKTHGEDGEDGEEAAGGGRPHRCPRCALGFSCAGYLARHLQTHREERPHACDCGKSFACRAALTAHQRTHGKERPHACAQCGKGFLYKGGLLSHMQVHSEEKPFACSFCAKSFKRQRNMKKHERCHTRQDVFGCSLCDKSFVYKATLTRHQLTHSGERPFLCADCGKGFFSHAELLKHERFHTGHAPFQCPHCGKKFTQSCYLTIHLRYHTGARPYACSECDKSFLSANRLKRHQRTHSGEKPYLCAECGKSFRQSYNMKVHQRTHATKRR